MNYYRIGFMVCWGYCYICYTILLGVFTKLRNATVGSVMCVCLHGAVQRPLDGFLWSLILEYFLKICWKKLDKN